MLKNSQSPHQSSHPQSPQPTSGELRLQKYLKKLIFALSSLLIIGIGAFIYVLLNKISQ
ncbi:hypothetical protein ABSA28_01053 [Candidatus Hepatincolaceae symbiont of Richtersius coronifer]